jgi:hypothetical protein
MLNSLFLHTPGLIHIETHMGKIRGAIIGFLHSADILGLQLAEDLRNTARLCAAQMLPLELRRVVLNLNLNLNLNLSLNLSLNLNLNPLLQNTHRNARKHI